MRFDVNTLKISGAPVSVLSGIGRPGNPATILGTAFYGLSDQGTLVYARAGSPGFLRAANEVVENTLVWVDRQGAEEPFGAPAREYVYPRISPDGQHLVLAACRQSQPVLAAWRPHR